MIDEYHKMNDTSSEQSKIVLQDLLSKRFQFRFSLHLSAHSILCGCLGAILILRSFGDSMFAYVDINSQINPFKVENDRKHSMCSDPFLNDLKQNISDDYFSDFVSRCHKGNISRGFFGASGAMLIVASILSFFDTIFHIWKGRNAPSVFSTSFSHAVLLSLSFILQTISLSMAMVNFPHFHAYPSEPFNFFTLKSQMAATSIIYVLTFIGIVHLSIAAVTLKPWLRLEEEREIVGILPNCNSNISSFPSLIIRHQQEEEGNVDNLLDSTS